MNREERLEGIRTKAEGMGLDYVDTHYSIGLVTRKGQKVVFDKPAGDLDDSFFEPIETLLAALSPKPREPIPDFAAAMEAKLKTTDHKGGRKAWLDIHEGTRMQKIAYFKMRILDELDELMQAETPDEVMGEAIDIANFALMVWDNARLLKEEENN